ncbi:NAD(P)H-binding protein [Bacillus sp. B-jedd]|uniref:NAD(P)H-binding protein n=1 Tax=Bacillus sp. B-jedd TaxID=1476857 RepID=UPI00051562AC|nr:NAD(P)H-binding protein [Bacillus sp. B-jedd]CEG26311.1 NAD dependent epimerase/dehydratase [Bacillus sp. B-jedd]
MKVLVIGTNDLAGEQVVKLLAEKGYEAVALAGSENARDGLKKLGASDVVVTDGEDYSEAFFGCEAVIYLGSASQRTGESKPILVDNESVNDAISSAKKNGAKRFVLLSPLRGDENEGGGSGTVELKEKPEELLRKEELAYTIIRPSKPVDKPGKGKVEVAEALADEEGEIPKEDLASVLVEVLEMEGSFNKTFAVTAGETPIRQALTDL